MGHKMKKKCVDSRVNAHDLASTGVPFTLTTVQVQNLALTHYKRISVQDNSIFRGLSDFRYAFRKPRAFFERTSIVSQRKF
jgi:hypothetical protein